MSAWKGTSECKFLRPINETTELHIQLFKNSKRCWSFTSNDTPLKKSRNQVTAIAIAAWLILLGPNSHHDHPMRNFPYDIYCANRDLPHNGLSCCVIKFRTRRLSMLDLSLSWKKWHWRVSNPCAFSVKERHSLAEKAHCDRTPNSSALFTAPRR